MKIDAEVKTAKSGKSLYIYIPILKKVVFLQGIEEEYIKMLIAQKKAN